MGDRQTRSRSVGSRARIVCFWSFLHAGLCPVAGLAQPIGPEGSDLGAGEYSVDLSQGPVLSSSRVTGLSGAFAALAEGLEGGLSNPAAVAVRTSASVDFWDYWVGLGITYPFENGDFYNSGDTLDESRKESSDAFLFLTTGAYLQLFGLGLGLNLEILQISVRPSEEDEGVLRMQLVTNHVQLGYLFLDGQLALGGGLQILRERAVVDFPEQSRKMLHAHVGFGGELGVLIRPNGAQWRIGAGLYSSVKTEYGADERADQAAEQNFLPKYAVRPWRGSIAFAYQFGERPLNPRFSYVEEHAAAALRAHAQRVREVRREHARRSAALSRETGADSEARRATEARDFAEQTTLLSEERDAIRKTAWRELRAGVRRDWARRSVLLTAEVSLTGRVANGLGLESFLAQSVQRSGEHVTVTPRLAAESEVWPTHLKLRAGAYYEASRFRDTDARFHGTLGLDVRLFNWDVFRIWPEDYLWQLSGAVDIARDYQAFSVGIGGWY